MRKVAMELSVLIVKLWCFLVLPSCFQLVHAASLHKDANCKGKAADLIFALDSSSSIWEDDFENQLQFVESVVDRFPISESHVRVGLLTFGSDVQTQFNLADYFSKEEILKNIKKVPFTGGATNTGSAIKHAREVMFSADNGGREMMDKIMIVITDGYSVNSTNTSIEASISKSHGIAMFAVGIGYGLDDELKNIASKPRSDNEQFVLRAIDFKSLHVIESTLIENTCEVMHTNPHTGTSVQKDEVRDDIPDKKVKQNCGGKPAEVYFAVDSSSSIWVPNFQKMLHFIAGVVDMFDISSQHTRVGVVTYSDGVHPVITLESDLDKPSLKARIKSIPFLGGSTRTGSALKYLRKRGFSRHHARGNVAHVIILLTDGQSVDTVSTLEEAKLLRQMGVYIFALGIGNQVDKYELRAVASEPKEDFVFEMGSFDALASIKNTLAIKTCTADEKEENKDLQKDVPEITACKSTEPLDVMYVYDTYSLGKRKSELLAETIADIVTSAHKRDLRSGILTSTCNSNKAIPLSSYRRGRDLIDALRVTQSDTVPKLLHKLRTESYMEENGGRSTAKNVAFLFIDGNLENYYQIKLAAKRLKFRDYVKIYVVAIGNKEDKEIGTLCSVPTRDHLIHVKSYSEMESVKETILQKLCSV